MKCCEIDVRIWDGINKKIVCYACGTEHKNFTDKKIEKIKSELKGISPDFVVVDTSLNVKNPTYWCVIELVNIRGEVRTEHHEDIDLQDFEILYGGITDNILSIDLQRMPVQVMEVKE